ncbi:P-type ATPase, partial [Trinickia sp.]|uniref:P-type ATPase n=1 Tax=Trinickia sp. TaxID=2571163 RepID=UPI003F7CD957
MNGTAQARAPRAADRVDASENQDEGLTDEQAAERLTHYGPNAVDETSPPYWRVVASKFWAPIPWLLEAAVVLQLLAGAQLEAAVIAALLAFNVALSLVQEKRAASALSALTQRLEPQARVKRGGHWKKMPAAGLVPGDFVELSLGAVVPADARVGGGGGSHHKKALTGGSEPADPL